MLLHSSSISTSSLRFSALPLLRLCHLEYLFWALSSCRRGQHHYARLEAETQAPRFVLGICLMFHFQARLCKKCSPIPEYPPSQDKTDLDWTCAQCVEGLLCEGLARKRDSRLAFACDGGTDHSNNMRLPAHSTASYSPFRSQGLRFVSAECCGAGGQAMQAVQRCKGYAQEIVLVKKDIMAARLQHRGSKPAQVQLASKRVLSEFPAQHEQHKHRTAAPWDHDHSNRTSRESVDDAFGTSFFSR